MIEDNIDSVLTGVMYAVRMDNNTVRVTALRALLACVECCSGNFARRHERDYIIQTICELTQQQEADNVQVVAMECLNKIVTSYYLLMEDYMTPALIPISLHLLHSTNSSLVILACEFWCNICHLEEDLGETGEESSQLVTDDNTLSTEHVGGHVGDGDSAESSA